MAKLWTAILKLESFSWPAAKKVDVLADEYKLLPRIAKEGFLTTVTLVMAIVLSARPSPASAKSTDLSCGAKLNASAHVAAEDATRINKAASGKILSGIASWYGMPFHGRRTASGRIFDMNKSTGAHMTLPLSSRVLVENPHNGKKVVIEVTDRGPYIKNRVIDLSREAARRLGILCRGIAYVKYSVLPTETAVLSASGQGNDVRSITATP